MYGNPDVTVLRIGVLKKFLSTVWIDISWIKFWKAETSLKFIGTISHREVRNLIDLVPLRDDSFYSLALTYNSFVKS